MTKYTFSQRNYRKFLGVLFNWLQTNACSPFPNGNILNVIAFIKDTFSCSTPSISVSICANTRSPTRPPDPEPRSDPRASISSKKTIQGATRRALVNSDRIASSDSPTHLLKSSGPLIETKLSLLP